MTVEPKWGMPNIDDAPPERHADRIIAEMLREFASTRLRVGTAIADAIKRSKDGGPRAQRRMAVRIKEAGALICDLIPAKRGKYQMRLILLTGWNPATDREVDMKVPLPEKPWLCAYVMKVTKDGPERPFPMLLVTHHVLSRCAQRFALRTQEHIMLFCEAIFRNLLFDAHQTAPLAEFFAKLKHGHRLYLDDSSVVVLRQHEKYQIPVAVTIYDTGDGDAPAGGEHAGASGGEVNQVSDATNYGG